MAVLHPRGKLSPIGRHRNGSPFFIPRDCRAGSTAIYPSSPRIRGGIEMAAPHHRGKPLPIARHRNGSPESIPPDSRNACTAVSPSSPRIRGGIKMAAIHHTGMSRRTGRPELSDTGDAQDRVLSQSPRPFGGKTRVAAPIACFPKASLVESHTEAMRIDYSQNPAFCSGSHGMLMPGPLTHSGLPK